MILVLVDCTPTTLVKKKFLETSGKATFRKILMYLMGFLIKLQNATVSTVTLLKIDSTTDAHLAILKLLRALTGRVCPVNAGFTPDFYVNFYVI